MSRMDLDVNDLMVLRWALVSYGEKTDVHDDPVQRQIVATLVQRIAAEQRRPAFPPG